MEIRISKPNEICEEYLSQIIDLIVKGGQIRSDKHGIRELILLADFIAYKLNNEVVICTATLKNPYLEYREKVFNLAGVKSDHTFIKELGYIVTHPDFENQGHCQSLLGSFFRLISHNSIYATTRKLSMIHILNKHGFLQTGTTYNNDLNLLIYNSQEDDSENIQSGNENYLEYKSFQLPNAFSFPQEITI